MVDFYRAEHRSGAYVVRLSEKRWFYVPSGGIAQTVEILESFSRGRSVSNTSVGFLSISTTMFNDHMNLHDENDMTQITQQEAGLIARRIREYARSQGELGNL